MMKKKEVRQGRDRTFDSQAFVRDGETNNCKTCINFDRLLSMTLEIDYQNPIPTRLSFPFELSNLAKFKAKSLKGFKSKETNA